MSGITGRAGGGPVAQGPRGADPWSFRNWLDISRSRVVISGDYSTTATADTVYNLIKSINGSPAAAAASIGVTAGRILRLTSGFFVVRAVAAATPFATVTLREEPTGIGITTGSPSWGRTSVCNNSATISASDKVAWAWPEALEFSGNNVIGASVACQAIGNVISFTLFGYEYTPPA